VPSSFKEAPGWQPAKPADDVARGEWWTLFADPILTDLEQRVATANQNVAAAVASYDQARAAVREQRAALFPTIDLSAGATRAGSFGNSTPVISGGSGSGGVVTGGGGSSRRYTASIGASWEPDLFGRIRASVQQAGALAEASKADLLNVTLAAQGELALDYVQLRAIEAQQESLNATVTAYTRALDITRNRYNAGVAAQTDVLQAETQLRNSRADAADLIRQRKILEHAIAVLVGVNPSTFSLPSAPWNRTVAEVPAILPATLLERRPDVAAAERRVSAANAGIGIERSAFFPTIGLSGDIGTNSRSLSSLFTAASSVWSLGLTGALTLLDFGARSARVAQARAAYEQAVAQYRQTALTAFQQTEDALVASRILGEVQSERNAASLAANRNEQLILNQYLAGTISYTDVVSAQTAAQSARRAEISATLDTQTNAIALIQAIGGHWQ
jgi:NodT family efflux transporter outer membrane factor (OMF) lipoprotein